MIINENFDSSSPSAYLFPSMPEKRNITEEEHSNTVMSDANTISSLTNLSVLPEVSAGAGKGVPNENERSLKLCIPLYLDI